MHKLTVAYMTLLPNDTIHGPKCVAKANMRAQLGAAANRLCWSLSIQTISDPG